MSFGSLQKRYLVWTNQHGVWAIRGREGPGVNLGCDDGDAPGACLQQRWLSSGEYLWSGCVSSLLHAMSMDVSQEGASQLAACRQDCSTLVFCYTWSAWMKTGLVLRGCYGTSPQSHHSRAQGNIKVPLSEGPCFGAASKGGQEERTASCVW